MARKPPRKYKYEIGTTVIIDCIPEESVWNESKIEMNEISSRFAAVKGFGNTGQFLVSNRIDLVAKGKKGKIVDRTNGMYVVQYKNKESSAILHMALVGELEIEPTENYSDAVVRWLSEGTTN